VAVGDQLRGALALGVQVQGSREGPLIFLSGSFIPVNPSPLRVGFTILTVSIKLRLRHLV
jgi:hypothetical protein